MPSVTLVPFSAQEHDVFVRNLLTDKRLMSGWGMEPLTEDQFIEWIKDPTRVSLVVIDQKTKKFVGYVDFYDWDSQKKEADWGVVIDPAFSGKGYAQEAAKASIDYGFNVLKLHKIEIYIEADNHVSRHIHEKVGYQYAKTDEKGRRIYYLHKEKWRS